MSDNSTSAWKCGVCGFVHRDSEPPPECPVCGAPGEVFDAYAESIPEKKTAPRSDQWRCLVCGYPHHGERPPDQCPVCGTPATKFEAVAGGAEKAASTSGAREEIVVIGGGAAGIAAVEAIRRTSANANITLLSKEPHPPYYRLNLTRLLAGEITETALPIHPENWYRENEIDLALGAEVSAISLDNGRIRLKNGETAAYDKLVLTAGAHPFTPPIPGVRMEGVTTLRSLEDVRTINHEARGAESIVVIGGGILGLEIAGALAGRSQNITVLEGFDWLMPRQLNRKAASLLQDHLRGLGVDLKTGVMVDELVGDERVAGVLLKNGETVPGDLVIMAAGVRSNSHLARTAGLRVNQGVIVDDFLQTSAPNVYAAGDVAEHAGVIYGLWSSAQFQGSIAGMNAGGDHVEFGGIPRSNSIKVLDVDLLSIGKFEPEDGSYLSVEKEADGSYMLFLFRDAHLVGSILYGDASIGGQVKKVIEEGIDMSAPLKKGASAEEIREYIKGK